MNYLLEYRPVGFGPDPDTGKENQGLKGIFHIPAYQRGYRWTRHEVSKLLDDLAESATEQQNSVAEDLNKNIDTIHSSVKVIALGANQTAESSQSLAQLTAQLRQMTMRFQT